MASGKIPSLPADYYNNFLSDAAKLRKPSPIRSLYPLESAPGLLSLLAGKPNPTMFPFKSFTFSASSPTNSEKDTVITLDAAAIGAGLQYGPTSGHPDLIRWLTGLQERVHGRKGDEEWRITIGTGSQDLISKAFLCLLNPGDPILVQSPVYVGILPLLESLHCEMIEVETDAEGISSSSMRSVLESWPSNKPKPKLLYTVPYGGNPTGTTVTTERREEILRLSKEHDILILEDDPYFNLYFGTAPHPPSFFSLENEMQEHGRVLRFDSFSKILSSGLRLGFVTGPKPILDAIDRYTSTANLQSSSLTQVIAYALLDSWGYDGFQAHVSKVSAFYREKRDVFQAAMARHLTGLVTWSRPEAGLFFWFELKLQGTDFEGDSESVIRTTALEHGVLALPGTVFFPDSRKTAYVRAAFSLLEKEEVEEAMKRLRETILEVRRGRG